MNLSLNDQIRIRVQVRNQWITPEQEAAQHRIMLAEVEGKDNEPVGK